MSELQGHPALCLMEHPLEPQHGESTGLWLRGQTQHRTFSPNGRSHCTCALGMSLLSVRGVAAAHAVVLGRKQHALQL